MTVSTPIQPNSTIPGQSAVEYKAAIDAQTAALAQTANMYAPHEAATPNMTVVVDAGRFMGSSTALVQNAQQTTATITAPVTNPRIDRVVIDAVTGVISVVTGAEAASPSAPAIPSGKLPVCQIALATSTTAITNSLLTDERAFMANSFGLLDSANTWTAAQTFSGLITANGGQIKFPATQAASADVNTLDDYEEGTFTPEITFAYASTGVTYASRSGSYVKIGRFVFFTLSISLSSKGSSTGQARVQVVPFGCSASSAGNFRGYGVTSVDKLEIVIPYGSNYIELWETTNAGAQSVLTDADFTGTATFTISGSYLTT